jgi:hypothetical protein
VALPDYVKFEHGTAVVWGEAGASGVTKTLTLDALASGAARMGASADLGSAWDQDYLVLIAVESGTAPTAGLLFDLYMACSHDNSTWPGGVTGSDGSYKSGEESEWVKQLEYVHSLVATNDSNVVQVQSPRLWRPSARYVAPVVHNLLGQALRDEATATNNDSRITLVPVRTLVQDAA